MTDLHKILPSFVNFAKISTWKAPLSLRGVNKFTFMRVPWKAFVLRHGIHYLQPYYNTACLYVLNHHFVVLLQDGVTRSIASVQVTNLIRPSCEVCRRKQSAHSGGDWRFVRSPEPPHNRRQMTEMLSDSGCHLCCFWATPQPPAHQDTADARLGGRCPLLIVSEIHTCRHINYSFLI
jgi:hypothetical protein